MIKSVAATADPVGVFLAVLSLKVGLIETTAASDSLPRCTSMGTVTRAEST